MDSSSIILLVVLLCLILMSGFFSSTETAFSCINKIRLKNREAAGSKRAGLVLRMAEDYDRLLSTILIGNNIVNLSAASIATVLFTRWMGERGVPVSTIVLTVVVLIFGEISPKSQAKERPERIAMAFAPLLRFFIMLLKPVNFLFAQWKKLLLRLFHGGDDPGITEEELMTLVGEAENDGGIDAHEGRLIRSAIEFHDLNAEDILTPRVDIVAVEDTDSPEEIAAIFKGNHFSRLPVFHENLDDIRGVIHEKDFYSYCWDEGRPVAEMMQEVIWVPENMPISRLLNQMQHAATHMAVVVDEFGGTAGIVTLEDVLEELVGEIWDEHDEVNEEFRLNPDGSYTIDCSANLEDMFDLFSIDEERDYVSVSGWVMEELGRIPVEGDRFTDGRLHVTVTKTDGRRVMEIRVVQELSQREDNRQE